jgi:hypothetical protein
MSERVTTRVESLSQPQEPKLECRRTRRQDCYFYATQCGRVWDSEDVSIIDAGGKFCPFCGGRITL